VHPIEDGNKFAEVQRIGTDLVECLDDLPMLIIRTGSVQLRKFATARHLIARLVKPVETPNKGEAIVRCQTRLFAMHIFGLSFVISI
jgi:hypothetical protein